MYILFGMQISPLMIRGGVLALASTYPFVDTAWRLVLVLLAEAVIVLAVIAAYFLHTWSVQKLFEMTNGISHICVGCFSTMRCVTLP
jgi:hypothetical protein